MNMPIQTQMHRKSILITGNGDLARALKYSMQDDYLVWSPSRDELDVSSDQSVSRYFSGKKIDKVINLAGSLYSSRIADSCVQSWIKDVNVNLVGTYLVCREAIRLNPSVAILNTASTAAFASYFDWSSYCAAKAGVIKISNALSLDGYNVVTLCPGAIETKLRKGLKIDNPKIMSIEEGIKPFIRAINGDFNSGDIIVYRKGEFEIIRQI